MGKRENFTTGRITAFQCEAGKQQSIFWDGKVPGLGLRVTASGAKSYIFETRLHSKTIRLTIGDSRTWTVAQAQAEATRLKAITDQGDDPRQINAAKADKAKAARKEADRKAITLGEAWHIYTEARRPKWGAWHIRDHERMTHPGGEKKLRGKGETKPGPLAPLLGKRLADLTAKQIAAWLAVESTARPTQAALAYRLLSVFVNWCESQEEFQGLIPSDVCRSKLVKEELAEKKTKEGDCLQKEQLPAWFSAVRALGNPVAAAYLQALLLTGARRRELASLAWDDVDFRWKVLTIRDKVEGERSIQCR